jgi:hypothetical protein
MKNKTNHQQFEEISGGIQTKKLIFLRIFQRDPENNLA